MNKQASIGINGVFYLTALLGITCSAYPASFDSGNAVSKDEKIPEMQLESTQPVAAYYKLILGRGVDVCEAYKRNFESFDNTVPMACERKYSPTIKGFSLAKWHKLDRKKYFNLYKKAELYIGEGWSGASKDDILDGIEGRAEYQRVELNLARYDLDGKGKLINVLSVRDFGCGPNPSRTEAFRKTRLYILNHELSDIDYKRQAGWFNTYNNSTLALYKRRPYIEHYEPDDNWGHLLTGSGRLYIMKEQGIADSTKEPPIEEVTGTLQSVCEFQYVKSSDLVE